MLTRRWTTVLVFVLLAVYGLELATHSVGNDSALLKLGALPDDGKLHGQYWRFVTYSFLHFNLAHLLVNTALIFWIGGLLEKRVGVPVAAAIYFCSVLCSGISILLVHSWHPKIGATVGASGGMFGLASAAIIIFYRDPELIGQESRVRSWLWLVILIGLTVSLLPGISLAGHIGGLAGGVAAAVSAKVRKNA